MKEIVPIPTMTKTDDVIANSKKSKNAKVMTSISTLLSDTTSDCMNSEKRTDPNYNPGLFTTSDFVDTARAPDVPQKELAQVAMMTITKAKSATIPLRWWMMQSLVV